MPPWSTIFEVPQLKQKAGELTDQMGQKDFWADQEHARRISKQHDAITKTLEGWQKLKEKTEELQNLAKLNESEQDSKIAHEITGQIPGLRAELTRFRLKTFLSGKYDDHDCLLSVHSGAGGTDAQDWAEILLRMYLRYAEREGWSIELIDKSTGAEAGIKSAVVSIRGPYAYGHLKAEAGVHRLVRQSPFNPAHTRETSFALIEVLPELESHEEFLLDPKELKIEASTSRGAGGQSVNTTYSAIRVTHIPTGIKVSIQNERSQAQNKAQALKILQSKLKTLEEEKQRQEKLQIRGEFHSAEWGNQIRSYVLHPYKLVKDHRTEKERTDPDNVLDGDLDDFIAAYLEKNRLNHSNN